MSTSYTYQSNSNSIKKAGDYEVFIEDIGVKTLELSGKEKLSIRFRIRDDVEQEYKNGIVFEDIWHEREHPEYFNRIRLNKLLGTQQIEDGKVFDDINAVIDFLKGSYLCIHLEVEFDDYNKQDRNVIKYYKKTSYPLQTANSTTTQVVDDLDDDELPF